MPIKNMLTVMQLAELLGVSRARVHKLIRTYHVPVTRITPRLLMIERRHVKLIPEERPNGVRHT